MSESADQAAQLLLRGVSLPPIIKREQTLLVVATAVTELSAEGPFPAGFVVRLPVRWSRYGFRLEVPIEAIVRL